MKRPIFLLALAVASVPACSTSPSGGPTSAGDAGADAFAPSARACTIAPPPPSDWRLHADGTLFRDALGRVVVLRGVDAGGRSKFAPYVPFDFASTSFDAALAAYLDRAASWGIDALRVPFTWAAVEPVQGQDDATFLQRYDALLDAAWKRGMWTIVDFHQDVYAENFCGDGFPSWTLPDPKPTPHHDCPRWGQEYLSDPDVQAAFDRLWASGSPAQAGMLAMWDRMIARHKDRPGVLGFEPINEPGWGSQPIAQFEAGTLTAFFSMMVPRMRAAAPSSLVFVDATGFDGSVATTSMTRPTGDGIVFAPHYYPLGGSGKPDAVINGFTAWSTVGMQWNVPVLVGEFGASDTDPSAATFMTAHFDAMDALGMSGTEWEYSVATEGWNGESYGMVAADGTELPVAQAIVRPYARAIAGTGIAAAFDASARTFTLSYAPTSDAGGVSEVALPPRAYPGGYALDLQGGCVDATSSPGRLLVKSDAGAAKVTLTVYSK